MGPSRKSSLLCEVALVMWHLDNGSPGVVTQLSCGACFPYTGVELVGTFPTINVFCFFFAGHLVAVSLIFFVGRV